MHNRYLIEKAARYMQARVEYDAARAAYDGYSWDWAGAQHIESLQQAEQDWSDAIDAAIRNYVAGMIAKCDSFEDLKRALSSEPKDSV